MMFMRFPIDAVFVSKPGADGVADGQVRAPRACGPGPGSCRWSAARTGCWSCRSGRSTRPGPRWATAWRSSRAAEARTYQAEPAEQVGKVVGERRVTDGRVRPAGRPERLERGRVARSRDPTTRCASARRRPRAPHRSARRRARGRWRPSASSAPRRPAAPGRSTGSTRGRRAMPSSAEARGRRRRSPQRSAGGVGRASDEKASRIDHVGDCRSAIVGEQQPAVADPDRRPRRCRSPRYVNSARVRGDAARRAGRSRRTPGRRRVGRTSASAPAPRPTTRTIRAAGSAVPARNTSPIGPDGGVVRARAPCRSRRLGHCAAVRASCRA